MPVDVNVKAPEFELMSHQGDSVKLAEKLAKGPVVLAFFPLAFTGVCTEEMCEFRDVMNEFSSVDAQVLGVSVDSRFALKAFAEQNKIEYPLLSDFNKQVSKEYGVQYENFLGLMGVAKRSVFVIDRDGTIRYRWVTEDAKVKPEVAEIRKALDQLKK